MNNHKLIVPNSSIKPREEYFDIVKGLTILLVMIGHSSLMYQCGLVGKTIEKAIFSFHMPIFFIVNGYFISQSKPSFTYACRRNIKLFLALCLFAAILVFFYHKAIDTTQISYFKYYISVLSRQPHYLWFFWATILSSTIVIFLRPVHWIIGLAVTLILSLIAIYGYSSYPMRQFYLYQGLVGAFFVYIGYLARTYRLYQRSTSKWLLLPGLVFLCWSCTGDDFLDLNYMILPYGLLSMIAAVFISDFVIRLGICFTQKGLIRSFLMWSGRNVFILIFMHTLEFLFVRPHFSSKVYINLPVIILSTYIPAIIILFICSNLILFKNRVFSRSHR